MRAWFYAATAAALTTTTTYLQACPYEDAIRGYYTAYLHRPADPVAVPLIWKR